LGKHKSAMLLENTGVDVWHIVIR